MQVLELKRAYSQGDLKRGFGKGAWSLFPEEGAVKGVYKILEQYRGMFYTIRRKRQKYLIVYAQ